MKTIAKLYPVLLLTLTLLSCKNRENLDAAEVLVPFENDSVQVVVDSLEPHLIDSFQFFLDSFLKDPVFKTAGLGFYLMDAATSEIIAEVNPDKAFVPASTMKVLTTATALEVFGPKKKFTTSLEYDGQLDSNTLHGNIFIHGGGDPVLGSKAFKKYYYNPDFVERWADTIIKLGIDTIDGRIIADAGIFDTEIVPTSWTWEDIAAYYGTAACGLSIYDNTFRMTFDANEQSVYKPNKDSMEPFIPGLVVENKIRKTKDAFYLDILGSYYNDYRVIHGVVPEDKNRFSIKGSIPDPPFVAAYALEQKLLENGVVITGKASTIRREKGFGRFYRNDRKEFYKTYSPSLSKIIYKTNQKSVNLYAEHLIKLLGYEKYNYGDHDSGAKAIFKYWIPKNIHVEGLYIADGCGISRKNTVTAKQLVGILNYMLVKSPYSKTFQNSLPVSGKSGTLKYFCDNSPAEGKIWAKSGTMSRVRSYAGYIKTNSDRELVFAIIVNNFNCPSGKMKRKLEDLLIKVVEII